MKGQGTMKEEKKKKTEDNVERLADLRAYKLYSLKDLETVLGVTHRTLLNYVKDGRLPRHKIAGKYRVTEAELQAFLEGKRFNEND